MPLTTPGSYLPTIDSFLTHWALVNAELGGAPATDMKLSGGYTRTDLQNDRAAIQAALVDVISKDNARQAAADQRDLLKADQVVLIKQVRSAIRGAVPGNPEVGTLPTAAPFSSIQTRFVKPLHDVKDGWGRVNALAPSAAFTPPLLVGTMTVAQYTTKVTALEAAYTLVRETTDLSRVARNKRDALLKPVKTRLKQYRDVVIGKLGPNHVLIQSIPAISPPPGSTPLPVEVSVEWDADLGKAVLTWTTSDNPNLDYYSIRTAPGPVYKAAEEQVIGQVQPGTLTFETLVGLAAPGSTALYRVYVVLKTGNEKGSSTAKLVRPSTD